MKRVAKRWELVRETAEAARRRYMAAARGEGDLPEGMDRAEAAKIAAELEDGLRYMQEEPALVEAGELDEAELGDDYTSRHPVIGLVQGAINLAAETGDATAAKGAPGPEGAAEAEDVAAEPHFHFVDDFLHFLLVPKHPFIKHEHLDDFRFELPEQCRVALVGDWGTGTPGQRDVARAIAAAQPQHVIHMGDVYPTGAKPEVDLYFIQVWQELGPPKARFWALNGNHEMYAKGTGYFEKILPFCGQPASYFRLENRHWRLIGLDSSYDEYTLRPPQWKWLSPLLAESGPANILLTHHQVFSALDGRPSRHKTEELGLGPAAVGGGVYGWFWGHEHNATIYERAPQLGGMRGRCIGHGGKTITLPASTTPRFPAPPIVRVWDAARDAKTARNGFVLATFDGPKLHLDYRDETGATWFAEDWTGTP
ncbi:MAG: metallophosphoesterase family protein [Longimicrobiaceae bacterium]